MSDLRSLHENWASSSSYPYWVQTYSGRAFDLLHPRAEDVDPVDVAAALSRQCRFGGHVRCAHYSVAEHCVRAAAIVPHPRRKVTLLHDSPEAYVVDVPRPLKKLLGAAYAEIELRVARAVGERFGVDLVDLPPETRHADEVMLATEKRDIMAPPPRDWLPLPEPLRETIFPMSQAEAFRVFLELLGT